VAEHLAADGPDQRAVAAERGPLFMGGTAAARARELAAADLVQLLVAEAEAAAGSARLE